MLTPFKIDDENKNDFPLQVGQIADKLKELIRYYRNDSRYWETMSISYQSGFEEAADILEQTFKVCIIIRYFAPQSAKIANF